MPHQLDYPSLSRPVLEQDRTQTNRAIRKMALVVLAINLPLAAMVVLGGPLMALAVLLLLSPGVNFIAAITGLLRADRLFPDRKAAVSYMIMCAACPGLAVALHYLLGAIVLL